MQKVGLKFYFDYVSPNAYLAWMQLPKLIAGRGIEVEPVPVLFAALLDAHGQRGPAEIPAKMRWMVENILRKARALRVPLNPPASHPFNPLLALRVSSLATSPEEKTTLITAIFEGVWVRRMDISNPNVLHKLLNEAGLDDDKLLKEAGSAKTKHLLRQQTTKAIEAGVFGVPTIITAGKLFWGFDDFLYLEAFLDGKLPPDDAVKTWSEVAPSAQRKNVF